MARKSLKYNLLTKEIIRVDLMKIENIEEKISKLKVDLKGKGYELRNERMEQEANKFIVEDPIPLITQEAINKKRIEGRVSYIFQKEDVRYIINDYLVIFEKNNFERYNGIEEYVEQLNDIIQSLCKNQEIQVQRIGVRKTNTLVVDRDCVFQDIFQYFIKNDIANEENSVKEEKINVMKEEYSYNIIRSSYTGTVNATDKTNIMVPAYLVTLDLDFYLRNLEDIAVCDVKKTIDKLNILLHQRFEEELTEDMKKMLEKEEIKEEMEKFHILGGLNTCKK